VEKTVLDLEINLRPGRGKGTWQGIARIRIENGPGETWEIFPVHATGSRSIGIDIYAGPARDEVDMPGVRKGSEPDRTSWVRTREGDLVAEMADLPSMPGETGTPGSRPEGTISASGSALGNEVK
jgi:hypothetical protein